MKRQFVRGCSFCGKPVNKVNKLIGTPKGKPPAYICDECVAVCNKILDKNAKDASSPPPNAHYRVETEPGLHKENWFQRMKSWWKYGIIGKATLTQNQ